MKRFGQFLLVLSLGTLAACAQPPHYQWGGYEPALYGYYKDPALADAYAEKVAEAVKRGEQEGHVAPGLHAEYGYVLMNSGRKAEAIAEFEAEKKHWPESALLMDRMIRLANGQDGGPARTGTKTSAKTD
jgi:hypothetical protein